MIRIAHVLIGCALWSLPTLVGSPVSLHGQTPLEGCRSDCGLTIQRVALLGESTGPGYVGYPRDIVRRSDGIFAVLEAADQDRVKFFDPDGSFLRAVGRRGQGPGEFQTTNHILLLENDSVEVYDLGNRRLTVIAPNFTIGRTSRAIDLMSPQMVRLPDNTRVMNGARYSPDGLGFPLHHVDPEGGVLASFGADPPIEDLTDATAIRRKLATNNAETVWSVARPSYRLEEWAVGGERLRTLEREVSWFPPHDGSIRARDGSPLPYAKAIHQDETGLLWVIIWVPGDRWQEGLSDGPRSDLLPGPTVTDYSQLYDSVVEVIDPEAERVVRSQRFDVAFRGFVRDGLLYSDHVEDTPDFRIALWGISAAGGG